jgi:ClpP class serine protease
VTAIVLVIDSPGGDAAGCCELGRWIRQRAVASGKAIYAFTDSVAASAAYAIACSATAGIFLAPTARVGSVGVITVAAEQSAADRAMGLQFSVVTSGARKADGHPHVPISDGAISAMQSQVDAYAALFYAHVAELRGLPVADVQALEAAVFIGAGAVGARLADQVTTFDELIAMVAKGGSTTELSIRAKGSAEMTFEEMLAALQKAAEGDGEEADKAKKMLKAIEPEEAPKSKKDAKAEGEDDEEEAPKSKKDAKAEGEDDEEEAPKSKDATKAIGGSATAELATQVQRLSAKVTGLQSYKAEQERAKLIATRPDLAPELVAILTKKDKAGAFITPMATVREVCKGVPGAKKKDLAAAEKAVVTRGAGQGGNILGGVTRVSSAADELDNAFGLTPSKGGIRREGARMVFAAMTPEEARVAASKTKKEA